MAFRVGEAEVVVGGNVIPLTKDLLKAERKVKASTARMGMTAQKAGRKVASGMKGMFAAIGLGAAGVAAVMVTKRIISIGAQYEQSMAAVRGVTRATDKQFEALSATAKRLGETTEFTASQAAGGLRFLGMAGFGAEKAIAALPGVLDLATASGVELARSADIASNALTAMQLDVGELGRVNDVFVSTITRSNTNMEMLADSFRYAAPKANAYGYSIEQLSGMIGALGNAGVQGSMAGTQLSFAFSRVEKVAKKLGLGAGAQLIDVLRAMNAAGWDTGKVMKEFGERGGRAALILKGIIPTVERLTAANMSAAGEAKKLADTMRDTVIGAWKELKSAVEGIAIDAFTSNATSLKDDLRELTKTVRDNKEEWVSLAGALVKAANWFAKVAASFAGMNPKQVVEKQILDIKTAMEEVRNLKAAPAAKAGMLKGLESALIRAKNRLFSFQQTWDETAKIIREEPVSQFDFSDPYDKELKAKEIKIKTVIEPLKVSDIDIPRPSSFTEPIEIPVKLQEYWDFQKVSKAAKDLELPSQQIATDTEVVSQHKKAAQMKVAAERQAADEILLINEELKKAEEEKLEQMRLVTQANGAIANSMTSGILDIIDGTKSLAQAFGDMAKSILRDLASMIIKQAIFNALQKAASGLFGVGAASEGAVLSPASIATGFRDEAAQGAVLTKPKVDYFEEGGVGGVVPKMTSFAHAGGLGVMAEKGPEAIMPLAKTSGGLGVTAVLPKAEEVKTPIFKPIINIPDIVMPEMKTLDIAAPDIIMSDVTIPDITIPDITIPDVATPEIIAPNMVAPEIIAPDIVVPEIIAPEIIAPNMVAPEIIIPDVVMPDIVIPEMTAPDIRIPDMVVPEINIPDVVIPEVIVPEIIVPDVIAPTIMPPDIVIPESDAVKPLSFEPIINIPEAREAEPLIFRPTMTMPIAAAPSITNNLTTPPVNIPEITAPQIPSVDVVNSIQAPNIELPEIAIPQAAPPNITNDIQPANVDIAQAETQVAAPSVNVVNNVEPPVIHMPKMEDSKKQVVEMTQVKPPEVEGLNLRELFKGIEPLQMTREVESVDRGEEIKPIIDLPVNDNGRNAPITTEGEHEYKCRGCFEFYGVNRKKP